MLMTQTLGGVSRAHATKQNRDIRGTHGQNKGNTDLLLEGKAKGAQHRQRAHDGGDVGEDAQGGLGKVEDGTVDALAGDCVLELPRGLDGVAAEQVDQSAGDRVANGEGEKSPDGPDHLLGGEDAEVEEQDGALGETGGETKGDGGQEVVLQESDAARTGARRANLPGRSWGTSLVSGAHSTCAFRGHS
jgi:hypothetical protein